MKKLLVILFVLASLAGSSQTYTKVSGRWAYQYLKADSLLLPPAGTTAQRPSFAVPGALYFNTDSLKLQVYTGSSWITNGASGVGGTINLTKSYTSTTATITPSGGGTPVTLDPATISLAGVMTAANKQSLDSAWTKRVILNDSVTVYYNSQGIEVYRTTDSAFSFINSLENPTSRTAQLKNDQASPGANKVYGTDGSGVKGWKADPSGGGLSGLTSTRIPFATSSTTIADDSRLTYNSSTKYLTTDTFSILKQHYRTQNGIWSIRHNFQADSNFNASGTFPTSWFTSGSDGTFRDIDGQFDNVEYRGYNILTPGNRINTNEAAFWHQEESHFIAGGTSQFEIHDDFINKAGTNNYRWFGIDIKKVAGTGNGYWRADSWNWFQSGSTLRPMLTLSPAKLEYDLISNGAYFSVTKSTTSDYLRIGIDTINNEIPITHTKPLKFSGAVNVNGAFTTTASVGSTPVEFGNLTLKSASSSQLWFAPGNSVSYGMGQIWNSAGYGGIGLNAPNVLGRALTSNEGIEILPDARGVVAPLRIGTITTAGVETFTSVGADGRWAIGQNIQSPPVGLYINFSDAIRIPVGNTAARPSSPAVGYMRYNTDSLRVEVFNGTIWRAFLYNGEATGGGGSGLTSLNSLTGSTQTFATGTSGTDFGISSVGTTHTFNIPDAGSGSRGLVNTGAQDFQGVKTFTNKPLGGGSVTGQSFEVGTFGISSSGAASLRFGPSNTDNKAGWSVNSDYMSIGLNAANTFGNDGVNNGAEFIIDRRSGVADPFRYFINKIGTSTLAMSINDDAEVKIGSSTTQSGYKLQVTGGLYLQGSFRLGGTNVAVTPSHMVVKQTDSTISEIAFPGGTSTFLAANGTFQTPTGGISGGTNNVIPKFTGTTTLGLSGISDDGTTVTSSRQTSVTGAWFSTAGAVGSTAIQTISTGTATTISNNIQYVFVDPASLLASHTITMPASPISGQIVDIIFGGNIAAGSTVVTALTISANSGQTLFGSVPTTANGADVIRLVYSSSKWYRVRL